MPFHDLNIVHSTNLADLANTLAFQAELEYGTVAIAISVTGKLPNQPDQVPLSNIAIPVSLSVLSRITITISDTSQNHRLNSLTPLYDLVALRPTNEKAFLLCCNSLECDLISLDLSQRLLYPIKFKTVASALQRGVRFEICYSPGIIGGHDARRNLIGGAASLIRATRGRGIIISSEAKIALGARAPMDVINLAQVWGLNQERAKEALCEEAGKVVRLAKIKRTSFRGVVDIVQNGSTQTADVVEKANSLAEESAQSDKRASPRPASPAVEPLKKVTVLPNEMKRKASSTAVRDAPVTDKPLSKRELKRRAKRARLDKAADSHEDDAENVTAENEGDFPIKHESIQKPKPRG